MNSRSKDMSQITRCQENYLNPCVQKGNLSLDEAVFLFLPKPSLTLKHFRYCLWYCLLLASTSVEALFLFLWFNALRRKLSFYQLILLGISQHVGENKAVIVVESESSLTKPCGKNESTNRNNSQYLKYCATSKCISPSKGHWNNNQFLWSP